MAYRFRCAESVRDGVRRIVRERIDRALTHLEAEGDARAEGVHEARKRMKEIRAVIRLVRGELDKATFRAENRWFRDTARGLSEARDAQAAIETVDKLAGYAPERLGDGRLDGVRERLVQRLDAIDGPSGEVSANADDPVPEARRRLRDARERLRDWPLAGDGFTLLGPGLARVYRDGRDNMAAALDGGHDEAFHEWRKRVKDLWYHTTLLSPAWEPVLDARKSELKALSDAIGDDHDQVVLRALIEEDPWTFGDASLREQLLAVMADRQQALRQNAAELGRRIYAEKPKHHTRRMAAYWQAWRESPA